MTTGRFAIAYSRWFAVLATALGMGPASSLLDLDEKALVVEMGWAFSARVPRGHVVSVARHPRVMTAIGVHTAGWGDWVVNGATGGMVDIRIDPPAPARVLGFAVHLRRLRLSVDRPDEFVGELSGQSR